VARFVYGAGARIVRLNLGLRRRKQKTVRGFDIDPVQGWWKKFDEAEDDDAILAGSGWRPSICGNPSIRGRLASPGVRLRKP
jgi:hypothetical protein